MLTSLSFKMGGAGGTGAAGAFGMVAGAGGGGKLSVTSTKEATATGHKVTTVVTEA